ncbi:MAG: succinate dehydrogenase, hydrophobic membrane anchor protein [Phenylobacterium sp.]|jgi:succinate dehydrogenase / fumarate reductase membrane anchor subunit|uniref:succinate dehydrogenase, hydrophobic membrane anchor protein n=1 Tax=Phenylobacterium sp. TaxID=1871053 RepID=UPI002A26E0E9|nr:succinate dehydrogenase, hydrophobic membrane anchor protein [Phenylobacterium sp.]MDD3838392.1 succinate dehydrogenase, hydrophobic membrane anchor protein [Phenylobacterium sp.]MDX9996553.1 succinate dehydrogenase, hydrophobic membrane anchor protein [Phenylobacterium sp.]
MPSYRTPLSRARGLGAAGHGVGHWIGERVSAVALVPLVLWLVFSFVRLAHADHAEAVAWLRDNPLNPVLLTLLAAVSFWHMHDGMRVVVEDYIEKVSTKATLLILNLFVCVLAGGLAVFSILQVALGGQ